MGGVLCTTWIPHLCIDLRYSVPIPDSTSALTKRVSELYIPEEALSNTKFEKKFPFLVRTIAMTRPKRSYNWFRAGHLCSASTKLVGNFYGLGEVFCCRFRILSWRGGDSAPLKHWQDHPIVCAHTPR
jgi:hypothetical protein